MRGSWLKAESAEGDEDGPRDANDPSTRPADPDDANDAALPAKRKVLEEDGVEREGEGERESARGGTRGREKGKWAQGWIGVIQYG